MDDLKLLSPGQMEIIEWAMDLIVNSVNHGAGRFESNMDVGEYRIVISGTKLDATIKEQEDE